MSIEAMKRALDALNVYACKAEHKRTHADNCQAEEAITDLLQAIEQAQRQWVELTDDEMLMIYGQDHEGKKYNLGRMVQQALKEKNT